MLGNSQKVFTFDAVSGEDSTQTEMFQIVGKEATKNCVEGYHTCIFTYGQTGSGKTHTLQGPTNQDGSIDELNEQKGLIPRVFEYLFYLIQEKEKMGIEYLCKCSYLEIYNETITDLLKPGTSKLKIREDFKKGVMTEGLSEEIITNSREALEFLRIGSLNRHIGSTSMNKQSSRSHSVFSISIESKDNNLGSTNIRFSRLNLIDLAGSERQSGATGTNAKGLRLKEAGNINKSLSVLGNVIRSLADISQGLEKHVPYRDSKLTFLLKDCLGGNSKTSIIATISPAEASFFETISTLNFASRAKFIKNNAIVNEDSTSIELLQNKIKQLQMELQQEKSKGKNNKNHGNNEFFGEQISMINTNQNKISFQQEQEIEGLKDRIQQLQITLSEALERGDILQNINNDQTLQIKQVTHMCEKKDNFLQATKMIKHLKEAQLEVLSSSGILPLFENNTEIPFLQMEKELKQKTSTQIFQLLLEECNVLKKQVQEQPEINSLNLSISQLEKQINVNSNNQQEFVLLRSLTEKLSTEIRYLIQTKDLSQFHQNQTKLILQLEEYQKNSITDKQIILNLENELKNSNKLVLQLQSSLDEMEIKKNKEIEKIKDTFYQNLDSLKDKYELEGKVSPNQIDSLNSKLQVYHLENETLQKHSQELNSQLEILNQKLHQLQNENLTLQQQLDSFSSQNSLLSQQLDLQKHSSISSPALYLYKQKLINLDNQSSPQKSGIETETIEDCVPSTPFSSSKNTSIVLPPQVIQFSPLSLFTPNSKSPVSRNGNLVSGQVDSTPLNKNYDSVFTPNEKPNSSSFNSPNNQKITELQKTNASLEYQLLEVNNLVKQKELLLENKEQEINNLTDELDLREQEYEYHVGKLQRYRGYKVKVIELENTVFQKTVQCEDHEKLNQKLLLFIHQQNERENREKQESNSVREEKRESQNVEESTEAVPEEVTIEKQEMSVEKQELSVEEQVEVFVKQESLIFEKQETNDSSILLKNISDLTERLKETNELVSIKSMKIEKLSKKKGDLKDSLRDLEKCSSIIYDQNNANESKVFLLEKELDSLKSDNEQLTNSLFTTTKKIEELSSNNEQLLAEKQNLESYNVEIENYFSQISKSTSLSKFMKETDSVFDTWVELENSILNFLNSSSFNDSSIEIDQSSQQEEVICTPNKNLLNISTPFSNRKLFTPHKGLVSPFPSKEKSFFESLQKSLKKSKKERTLHQEKYIQELKEKLLENETNMKNISVPIEKLKKKCEDLQMSFSISKKQIDHLLKMNKKYKSSFAKLEEEHKVSLQTVSDLKVVISNFEFKISNLDEYVEVLEKQVSSLSKGKNQINYWQSVIYERNNYQKNCNEQKERTKFLQDELSCYKEKFGTLRDLSKYIDQQPKEQKRRIEVEESNVNTEVNSLSTQPKRKTESSERSNEKSVGGRKAVAGLFSFINSHYNPISLFTLNNKNGTNKFVDENSGSQRLICLCCTWTGSNCDSHKLMNGHKEYMEKYSKVLKHYNVPEKEISPDYPFVKVNDNKAIPKEGIFSILVNRFGITKSDFRKFDLPESLFLDLFGVSSNRLVAFVDSFKKKFVESLPSRISVPEIIDVPTVGSSNQDIVVVNTDIIKKEDIKLSPENPKISVKDNPESFVDKENILNKCTQKSPNTKTSMLKSNVLREKIEYPPKLTKDQLSK